LVTAKPVIDPNLQVNPCKMTITLKAFPFTSQSASPSAMPSTTPSASPVATAAAEIKQPETGPASVYWMSLLGLGIIWFGAELWYLHNRQTIG
jgi:hypothetical protein